MAKPKRVNSKGRASLQRTAISSRNDQPAEASKVEATAIKNESRKLNVLMTVVHQCVESSRIKVSEGLFTGLYFLVLSYALAYIGLIGKINSKTVGDLIQESIAAGTIKIFVIPMLWISVGTAIKNLYKMKSPRRLQEIFLVAPLNFFIGLLFIAAGLNWGVYFAVASHNPFKFDIHNQLQNSFTISRIAISYAIISWLLHLDIEPFLSAKSFSRRACKLIYISLIVFGIVGTLWFSIEAAPSLRNSEQDAVQ